VDQHDRRTGAGSAVSDREAVDRIAGKVHLSTVPIAAGLHSPALSASDPSDIRLSSVRLSDIKLAGIRPSGIRNEACLMPG
jgi:hypothetical protein